MNNKEEIKQKRRIRCKRCGAWATMGEYKDGVIDYLCEKCDVTFLDNNEQTIIS